MDAQYLLDTNIFIYIRQKRSEALIKRFQGLRPGQAGLSIITHGELLYGAEKSEKRSAALERLQQMTHFLPVLMLPPSAADAYGAIRADLESKGHPIGNNDLWIAAHALAGGLVLVTSNEREFRRVKRLKVQNWLI